MKDSLDPKRRGGQERLLARFNCQSSIKSGFLIEDHTKASCSKGSRKIAQFNRNIEVITLVG